jgi:hypothetical protein
MSPNPIKIIIRPIRESESYSTVPDVTADHSNDDCTNEDEEKNDDRDADDDLNGGMSGSSFTLEDLSRFPQQLAAKVDWITQCHNPLEYLQSLGSPPGDPGDPSRDEPPSTSCPKNVSGGESEGDNDQSYAAATYIAFRLPHHCEYCGSPSTAECGSNAATADCTISRRCCQRPPSYFPKQRPPFCQKDKRWDSVTEYENPMEVWKKPAGGHTTGGCRCSNRRAVPLEP